MKQREKKPLEWMAWSTFLREEKLAPKKGINAEVIIEELGIEWQVGSYKFNRDDLYKVVKHFKIKPKEEPKLLNREIQVYLLGDNHYAFIVQDDKNKVSSELITAIRIATNDNSKKTLLNLKEGGLYNEQTYQLLTYWKQFKAFMEFHYDMELTNAFREEMGTVNGSRVIILPIDDLTNAIIAKLKETKGNDNE